MLFDDICSVIEASHEMADLEPFVRDAKLVVFDSDSAPKPSNADAFALPYDTTAVTSSNLRQHHLVVWRRTSDDWREGHEFLFAARLLQLLQPTTRSKVMPQCIHQGVDPNTFVLIHGQGRMEYHPDKYQMIVRTYHNRSWTVGSDGLNIFDTQRWWKAADLTWFASSVQHSVEMIAAINRPHGVVLVPKALHSRDSIGRTARSHEQTIYRVCNGAT